MLDIIVNRVDCEDGIGPFRATTRNLPPTGPGVRTRVVAANPLERLVQISQANDRLMEELATSRRRIVRARDYLNSAGCNARFGAENLAFCKGKHRGVLAQLRANRIEANRVLGLDGELRSAS